MLHQAHEGGVRKTFGEFYRLNALPVKVGLSAHVINGAHMITVCR